jgi:predicted secreted protein
MREATVHCKIVNVFVLVLLVFTFSRPSSGLSETAKITVSKKDSGESLELHPDDVLQIELQGTPSTGFWWHFESLDTGYLELITEETRDISPGKIEGGPVLGIWQLRARKVGTTMLEMAYYRPWEAVESARGRFSLIVEIRPAGQ